MNYLIFHFFILSWKFIYLFSISFHLFSFSFLFIGAIYDLTFTAVPPQKLRLRTVNANTNKPFTVCIYYGQSWSLEVYRNDVFTVPINAELNEDGEVRQSFSFNHFIYFSLGVSWGWLGWGGVRVTLDSAIRERMSE